MRFQKYEVYLLIKDFTIKLFYIKFAVLPITKIETK